LATYPMRYFEKKEEIEAAPHRLHAPNSPTW
jgi:hypothetical protein